VVARKPVKKTAAAKKTIRPFQKPVAAPEDLDLDTDTEEEFEDGTDDLEGTGDPFADDDDETLDPDEGDEDPDADDAVHNYAMRDFVHNGVFTTEYDVPTGGFTTEAHLGFLKRVIADAQSLDLHARTASANRIKFNRDKTKVTYGVSVRES